MLALVFIASGSIILNIVLVLVLKSDADRFSAEQKVFEFQIPKTGIKVKKFE